MQLSFWGGLVRNGPMPLMARIQAAKAAGYGAVEFNRREVEEHLAARSEVSPASFWEEAGVAPGLAGGVPVPAPFAPEADFERDVRAIAAAAAAAAAAGARIVGTYLPNRSALPEADASRLIVDRLRRVAVALAPHGLRFAVEFIGVRTLWPDLPHPFAQEYSDVLALLDETGCDNIGLLLDSYHCHGAAVALEDIAHTPAERILYLHVNDCKPGPASQIQDADRLLPGEGAIDLAGWFRAVARTGFDGLVAPEILGPRLRGMSTEQAAEACRRGTVRAMRQAGLSV